MSDTRRDGVAEESILSPERPGGAQEEGGDSRGVWVKFRPNGPLWIAEVTRERDRLRKLLAESEAALAKSNADRETLRQAMKEWARDENADTQKDRELLRLEAEVAGLRAAWAAVMEHLDSDCPALSRETKGER